MADSSTLDFLRNKIRAIESTSHFNEQAAAGSTPSTKLHDSSGHFFERLDDHATCSLNNSAGSVERTGQRRGAFEKIVALVNASDRSEFNLRKRLSREGFQQDETEEAILRAKEYGIVDDVRYAEVLVRSRIAQGRGSAGIERELRENDIDVSVVPGWPFEYPVDYEQEVDRALELLSKKPPRSKNLRDGAYRKLMAKGYPSSVAVTAARQWAESQSNASAL